MKTENKIPYLTTTGHLMRLVNPVDLKVGQEVDFNGCKNYVVHEVVEMSWGVNYTLRYKRANGGLGKTKYVGAFHNK